jgi:hypothetical protein
MYVCAHTQEPDVAQVQDLQFAGPNEATMGAQICAGPTSSVVIDRQGMYWLAGKVGVMSTSVEWS